MNVESALPRSHSRPRRRTRTRVLVIDASGIMRDALCALLGVTEEFEVTGSESTLIEALHGAPSARAPDIILADFPQMKAGGAAGIAGIKVRFPGVRVVVLTFNNEDHIIKAALRAGAEGYVLKSDTCTELFTALRSVASGEPFISPSLREPVARAGGGSREAKPARSSSAAELTDREREVIRLIAAGHRTREIAKILSLSHKTIEKHRSSLMRKLGLRNASAVAAFAIAHGLA